jgi:indolepyruvate decarboxylase
MLRPGDTLVTETGTSSMGLAFAKMPQGSTFLNQTLWGAIGWATPAAFGAALAAPGRRTILITGEGSHQLTAQEVSQFYRFDLKSIIFVLNNDGYLIERLSPRMGTLIIMILLNGAIISFPKRSVATAGLAPE